MLSKHCCPSTAYSSLAFLHSLCFRVPANSILSSNERRKLFSYFLGGTKWWHLQSCAFTIGLVTSSSLPYPIFPRHFLPGISSLSGYSQIASEYLTHFAIQPRLRLAPCNFAKAVFIEHWFVWETLPPAVATMLITFNQSTAYSLAQVNICFPCDSRSQSSQH